jgi:hypothetical protein
MVYSVRRVMRLASRRPMKKDKSFSIRIDAETFAKLQKIAERETRSVNNVIAMALREYVKHDKVQS